MHEHLLCDIRHPAHAHGQRSRARARPRQRLGRSTTARGEARRRATTCSTRATSPPTRCAHDGTAGGAAIVELTCGGLSPDPDGPGAASPRGTGAHVSWAAATTSTTTRIPATTTARVEDFAEEMVGQVLRRRLGHRRARRHHRRDRLPGAVDRAGAAGDAGRACSPQRETGAADQRPSRPRIPTSRRRSPTSSEARPDGPSAIYQPHRPHRSSTTSGCCGSPTPACVIEFDLFGQESSLLRPLRHRHAERRRRACG